MRTSPRAFEMAKKVSLRLGVVEPEHGDDYLENIMASFDAIIDRIETIEKKFKGEQIHG